MFLHLFQNSPVPQTIEINETYICNQNYAFPLITSPDIHLLPTEKISYRHRFFVTHANRRCNQDRKKSLHYIDLAIDFSVTCKRGNELSCY
jgi:hypothetical protein